MIVAGAGIVAGLLASAPLLTARPEHAPLGRGLAALIFSFFFLSAVILASRHVAAEAFLAFSITSVLTYLTSVAACMVSGARRLA